MGDRDDEDVSTARYPWCIRVVACGMCGDDLTLWQSHIALRANRNDEVLAAWKSLLTERHPDADENRSVRKIRVR